MDRNDLDVAQQLGRIESKLDTVLERIDDHEERLRKVELRSAWAAGAAAVLGAAGGFCANLLFGKGQ
jgi:hypothetical protein